MKKSALMALAAACLLALTTAWLAAPTPGQAAPPLYRVDARTTTFGGSSYILGFGMCDLLNKHSSWVRGSVLESTGTPENIKVVGLDPGKRARTFFTCSAEMFEKAKKGEAPFNHDPAKFKDIMIMSYQQALAVSIITLDPKLKTLADLKGKRVATWPRGTTKYDMTYKLIGGAGKEVLDSIKWQYTGYAGYNDMILGKTDAAVAFCPEMESGVYVTVPKLKELMSKRTVYFVTATPAMRKLSAKLYGDTYGITAVMKKGGAGQRRAQPERHGLQHHSGLGGLPRDARRRGLRDPQGDHHLRQGPEDLPQRGQGLDSRQVRGLPRAPAVLASRGGEVLRGAQDPLRPQVLRQALPHGVAPAAEQNEHEPS